MSDGDSDADSLSACERDFFPEALECASTDFIDHVLDLEGVSSYLSELGCDEQFAVAPGEIVSPFPTHTESKTCTENIVINACMKRNGFNDVLADRVEQDGACRRVDQSQDSMMKVAGGAARAFVIPNNKLYGINSRIIHRGRWSKRPRVYFREPSLA